MEDTREKEGGGSQDWGEHDIGCVMSHTIRFDTEVLKNRKLPGSLER